MRTFLLKLLTLLTFNVILDYVMPLSKLNLTVENESTLLLIAKALSSDVRIKILKTLKNSGMSVSELAEALNQPVSSTALNVKILEDANLLSTEITYTKHGKIRLCRRTYDNLEISTIAEQMDSDGLPHETVNKIRVASYSDYYGITAPCGMVTTNGYIGPVDDPDVFFSPERIRAQLIWFTSGVLEYRISKHSVVMPLKEISLSFEACSEAPLYRNDHKSDISVWINDVEIGVWTSPGDMGGRRGQLNPTYWPIKNTQFGFWNHWRVDKNGTTINGKPVSDVNIDALKIDEKPYVSLKIGVKADAKNVGGLNLFGEKMGDYPQDIIFKMIS